jgi:hypothetical protein
MLRPYGVTTGDGDKGLERIPRLFGFSVVALTSNIDSPVISRLHSGESPAIAPRVARGNSRSDGGSS